MISVLKPLFSAHLRYILNSISAQSCDSVPPAPGWNVTMALSRSCSPERTVLYSSCLIIFWRFSKPSWMVFSNDVSSSSSFASSNNSSCSSTSSFSFFQKLVNSSSLALSLSTFWAASLSFQKSSFTISFSISFNLFSFESRSKTASYGIKSLL